MKCEWCGSETTTGGCINMQCPSRPNPMPYPHGFGVYPTNPGVLQNFTVTPGLDLNALVEALADAEHTRWSKWMKWMFDHLNLENIDRWRYQMRTPYAELSEHAKNSDRKEALITLQILKKFGLINEVPVLEEPREAK